MRSSRIHLGGRFRVANYRSSNFHAGSIEFELEEKTSYSNWGIFSSLGHSSMIVARRGRNDIPIILLCQGSALNMVNCSRTQYNASHNQKAILIITVRFNDILLVVTGPFQGNPGFVITQASE